MKKFLILNIILFLTHDLISQDKLSLKNVIEIAKEKSIRSKQIKNRYENSYWRNFSYKRQFLPALSLNGTLPQIQRSISPVTQNDGSEVFVDRNLVSNSADLTINQVVPLTGGNFFARTGLENIRLTGSTNSVNWLSRPIEIGYSQNIFGFNQIAWEKKVEPLYFSEADLLKIEEIEALSIEAVNRYFDLLRDRLSMENANKNLLNNDTIYKIGKGRYSYGKISENEILQLELSLLNSDIAYERQKLNNELSRQKLATFLGYSSQQKLELTLDTIIPEFEVNLVDALNYANQYHSIIVKQKREATEAQMTIARVKSENRVNLNLFASFGLSQTADNINDAYQDPQNQEFISMGVNMPIVQWGLGKGRVKQAQANAELVKSTIEQEKIDFEQGIYEKVARFNLNKKQLKVSKRANEVADRRFEVTKQRYLLGKILITDLQIAQQEKDQALIRYISSYRSFWNSYYDIRRTTHYDFETGKVIENKI